jgi:2-iminobutanoate/2-iminopropanoate deaminase
MKQAVSSPDAPKAIGPYSQAVRVGQLLFLSGQVPLDPATGEIVSGDIAAQTRRVFENLAAVLKAGGRSLNDVVRTTVFLADMDEFAAMNAVYARHVVDPPRRRKRQLVFRHRHVNPVAGRI